MKAIVLRKNYTEFKVYNIVPDAENAFKELGINKYLIYDR